MKKNIFYSLPLLLVIGLVFVSTVTKAQSKSYWEVNINGGPSIFFGDIKQYMIVPVSENENSWRFAAGLQLGRQLSYVFGVRGQALYGQVAGTRREWNRYFQSDYIETNLNLTVNLNNIFGKKRSDRFFNVYLITGIGLTQYNTTVYQLGTNKVLAKVGNGAGKGINGRTLEGILTVGMGADFRITDNFHINLESAHRGMNSDAFDHWENGFPFDIYNYTSLGLSWRFGLKNNKPPPYQYEEQDNYFEEIEVDTAQNEAGVAGEDELGIVEIGGAEPVQPPADSSLNETTVVDETPVVVQTEPAEPQKPLKPNPEYRVQIRAKFGKPLSREQLSAQYGIPVNEIMEDRHNGYYIYTIGSYATYDEAKERRNKLRNVNGIYDAFVVAFNECGRMDKLP